MTDEPGRTPDERLPARRPPSEPAPADRFTAPRTAHVNELTPERAAKIVEQSASARVVALLATLIVVLFTIIYYFYDFIYVFNIFFKYNWCPLFNWYLLFKWLCPRLHY